MPFEIPSDLHPDLMPLAWLLGPWHGNGQGEYPTIKPFTFEQDVVFAHDARPFLHYFSRAWITDDAGERLRPGALETGFLRPAGAGQVELVLAHATGYAEVWYGTIDGPRLTLATDVVARTPTAKDYTAGQRMYGLVEGDLMYAYDMAAEGQEMQSHLWEGFSVPETSPLLSLPGAVGGDAPDHLVAAHYGSIAGEQRRLLEGGTFVDLSHRDVVTISGPDRLTWLHSLTTQFLEGLEPGIRTEVLLLSPQGRIEHGFSGVDDGETFWAHAEPGAGTALVAFLDRMRFMLRVEVALVTDRWAVVGLPELVWKIVPRADLSSLPAELGQPVGLWAWEALRIEAGVPRIGLDTDELTIPNEAGLLNVAVHLDKGCYRGQETVARVHTLGRPPRRLVRLHLDGSVNHLPAHGSDVMLDGVRVGSIGTAARHHELGPIALALVKRNVDSAAQLIADGVAASQELIVDPEAGLHVRPVLR